MIYKWAYDREQNAEMRSKSRGFSGGGKLKGGCRINIEHH